MISLVKYSDWSNIPYNDSIMVIHTPKIITLHHSGTDRYKCYAEDVRGFQRYHMKTRKMPNIAYHFIINYKGTVYEGRKVTHKGDHCYPNTGRVGVCVIGDYTNPKPLSDKAYKSIIQVCDYICSTYVINNIEGHRDKMDTLCPGDGIYKLIPNIIYDVKSYKES